MPKSLNLVLSKYNLITGSDQLIHKISSKQSCHPYTAHCVYMRLSNYIHCPPDLYVQVELQFKTIKTIPELIPVTLHNIPVLPGAEI